MSHVSPPETLDSASSGPDVGLRHRSRADLQTLPPSRSAFARCTPALLRPTRGLIEGVIPAQLLRDASDRCLGADRDQLDTRHLGKVLEVFATERRAQTGVMRTAGQEPGASGDL